MSELVQAELLERDGERAVLAERMESTLAGDGGLVVVEGTAGIGKTRLLGEARANAPEELRVLTARGGELEGDFAFGVVRQLFEPLLATARPERRSELLAGAAALAAPLFDPSVDALQQGDTSFAVLHGLYWLAANVAFEQPTMLAIDDLHWADTPSLRWLCYLARRLEGLPLLVACAMRPPEQSRDPALLTELLEDPAATTVQPGPLTAASIAALVRRRFPDDEPDSALCDAIHAATRGNPLFVVALLDTVAREGVKLDAEHAHVLLELGPRVIGRAVSLRLARLGADATAVIEAAAVLGNGAELRHVAAIAGVELAAASRAAKVLVRADLFECDDPVEFFHPVVRTAIYDGLEALARSEGHRRAAEILLAAGAPPEQAAAHLMLATGHDDAFAVATLRAAAARALAQGAPDAAVTYLTRALAGARDEERIEVIVDLGLAERWLDPAAAAAHLSEGLELSDDPVRRAGISLELGNELFYAFRIPEAVEVYRRAYAEIDAEAHPKLHEWLEAEVIGSSLWDAEHYPVAEELMSAFDESRLHGGIGADLLLADRAFYLCTRATHRDEAVAAARRALASGRLIAHGALHFQLAAYTLFSGGCFEEAIAAYDAALAAARARGDRVRSPAISAFRGRALALVGNLEGALADLNESLLRESPPTALPYSAGFRAWALLDRGLFDEARATIDSLGLPDELPPTLHLFQFQLARGRLCVMTGDPERGVADLLDLGRRTQLIPGDNPADMPWRRFAAEGMLLLGRRDEATVLAREELEIAERWGNRRRSRPAGGASATLSAARTASRSCARPSPSRRSPAHGSSTRARSSTSAPRSDARTTVRRRASGCARAPSSPTASAPPRSSSGRTRSSPPPARGRARTPSAASMP